MTFVFAAAVIVASVLFAFFAGFFIGLFWSRS